MIKTVNQSWATPDKLIKRYGKTWAELDFEINPSISNYAFKNNPLDTIVGTLVLDRKRIPLKYKQLVNSITAMEYYISEIHFNKPEKDEKLEVSIFNNTFYLKKHEITKLFQTITDSCDTIMKSYKLGLYL